MYKCNSYRFVLCYYEWTNSRFKGMYDKLVYSMPVVSFQSDKDDSRIIKVSLWWLLLLSGVYIKCMGLCAA